MNTQRPQTHTPLFKKTLSSLRQNALISLWCLGMISTPVFASQTTLFPYMLGKTVVKVERYSTTLPSHTSSLTYFHPHEDEVTSYKETKKFIDKYGGTLYAIKQNGKRLIQFVLKGRKYTFDPNRIFTKQGVRATLEKYGPSSPEAIEKVYYFALWLSGVISSPRVIAVHNNYNKGYNIKSYQKKDGTKILGIKKLYINPNKSTGNFIYTTNSHLFSFAKFNRDNTALQDTAIEDDGSYSVFAQKHNIDYVNIEATRGDAHNNKKLLRVVFLFYIR